MFFDLIKYKIRILKPHSTRITLGGLKSPIDVPGLILSLDTKNANIIENYIKKNRLLEVLCGQGRQNYDRASVHIRWNNDIKQWHDINEEFMLLSANYPVFRSIWYRNETPILRDFRPAHEMTPVTIVKKRPRLLAKKSPKLTSFNVSRYEEMYGADFKKTKEKMLKALEPNFLEVPEEHEPSSPETELITIDTPEDSELTTTVSNTNWVRLSDTNNPNWYSTHYVTSTGGGSS